GSTCCQRPVPGERKSGMPEGTETPAPVRATTERASRTSPASRRCSVREATRERIALAAVEVGRAFGQEGGDPLPRVGAGEGRREPPLLVLDARVQIARRRDAFYLLEGERSLARKLARPGQRRVEQLVIVDHPIGEPQLERFLGQDRVPDHVHLQGL